MFTNRPETLPLTDREEIFHEPLLISVEELSMILKVSPRTVWRLLSAGKLIEPVRIGGTVRWRLQEVKDWINQGCPAVNSQRK